MLLQGLNIQQLICIGYVKSRIILLQMLYIVGSSFNKRMDIL